MQQITYLSEADRARLVEINQMTLGGKTVEELREIDNERKEIMARTKPMTECTYEELQELRRQLYQQHQKHAALGTMQTNTFAMMIKQVELREFAMLQEAEGKVEEKPKNEPKKPTGPSRVSTKQSSYSWTIPSDSDD